MWDETRRDIKEWEVMLLTGGEQEREGQRVRRRLILLNLTNHQLNTGFGNTLT